MLAKPLKHV